MKAPLARGRCFSRLLASVHILECEILLCIREFRDDLSVDRTVLFVRGDDELGGIRVTET